ncbi:DNA-directed DNA/RNA polymerase mu [Rhizophagus clarus]|uniref:DNA polymerase n=1 Tax=Rhizophagus clarus TaxID=94130 RepID=A0A8H3L0H0_9GLOM|nr:DNA-directed DNA/RNA polymerase mu [Rhizophagus clarus]
MSDYNFFKNWKFYIIDAKIPKDKLETLRYVSPETRKPICSIDWVEECENAGMRVPFDGFLVNMKPEPLSETLVQDQAYQSGSTNSDRGDSSDSGHNFTDDEQNLDMEFDLDPSFINTKYECLRPTTLESKYNQCLVELLEVIEHARELNGEERNALSYRHAIAALKAYPRNIESYVEARKIIGIGLKIGNHIKEFLTTGTILEAEEIITSEKYQILDSFSRVYGVGYKTALKWYQRGYRCIRECMKDPYLTHVQRLGLELFDDFQKKMSRQDIQEILDILDKTIKTIYPDCIITPVGGYRRGKEFNGDLDVVVSHPQETVTNNLLKDVVEKLIDNGYLKHKLFYGQSSAKNKKDASSELLSSHKNVMDNLDKCFCAFIQPSTQICRQVDLIIAPYSQYPTAVLGWTGSKQFERSLRNYAKKERKMTFASHGLFLNVIPRRRVCVTSEREVFDILGISWVEPEMRNC